MHEDENATSKQPKADDGQRDADKPCNTGHPLDEVLSNGVDVLQQKLGGYGRYQMFIYLLLGVAYITTAWQAVVPVFQGLEPDFHCKPSPGLSLNDSVPTFKDESGLRVYEKCKQFVNRSLNNETKYCSNGWNMTWSKKGLTSIVSEFSLVCDRHYFVELSTTMFMVGATCASLFLTPLSERFGQKTVMLASLWIQMVMGVASVWAGSIPVYILLRFFIGILYLMIALCVSVLVSENFDSAHRAAPALALQNFWSIGTMTLALLGYLIPDWKNLQLVLSIPISALSIFYIWLIPQSMPWLLSKGKVKEAENVIQRFVRINKVPSIPDLRDHLALFDPNSGNVVNSLPTPPKPGDEGYKSHNIDIKSKETTKTAATIHYSIFVLFKHRRLRIYTLILCFLFLANSVSFFGIIYNTPNLDGNHYFNLFLFGLVEIPAFNIGILVNRIIGRRLSILIFMLICASSNISGIFIPEESDAGIDLTMMKTAFLMFGKFGISASYSAVYLYASEIFPTCLRNQGIGLCSFFENIGSIAAPNVVALHGDVPLMIFGVMSAIGAGLTLLMPETHNRPLPQTISDAESRRRKKQTGKSRSEST